jgi:hypothetical protein
MSLFWNETRTIDYGSRLSTSPFQAKQAMVKFDGGWAAVNSLSDDDLLKMNIADIAGMSPLEPAHFETVLSDSVGEWRINPGRSFISAIGEAPFAQSGKNMFRNLECQTGFLTGLCRVSAQGTRNLQAVKSDNPEERHHRERGVVAITASENGVKYINDMARAFHVWAKRNAAIVRSGKVKLPKKLYRGVRASEPSFPEFGIKGSDYKMHEEFAADLLQARYDHLTANPIGSIFPGNVLSFTGNESIARYFADEKGFIVSVDPRDVDVVAGWSFTEELDSVDYESNKHEREWIIRLPPERILSTEDVEIFDADWLMVHGDYRGINLAGHSSKAIYEMNGHKIEAYFEYKQSGVGGSLRFCIDGGYMPFTKTEFKKQHGFDPIPKSADEVRDLQFWRYDRYSYSKKKQNMLISVRSPEKSDLVPAI